jgi:hypothetical protein
MKPEARLSQARYEAEQAKKRLGSSVGALQYRLKPGTLVNNAWEGVRDKSSDLADDALQAVKSRPVAASGVLAGLVVFLAREPLWRGVSRIFSSRERDDGVIVANLDNRDGTFDLTAQDVPRSANEGVNA